MPTKAQMRLVIITGVLLRGAWGLPKLWALRTLAEPGTGPATTIAGGVAVMS